MNNNRKLWHGTAYMHMSIYTTGSSIVHVEIHVYTYMYVNVISE